MGTFLSIAECYAGNQNPESLQQQIIDGLRAQTLADGHFVEVNEMDDANRTIFVGPANRWITILDSFVSNQEVAKTISEMHETAALATDIADSDVAYYKLYENGKLVDEYCSRPGLYDNEPEERHEALRGQPDKWAHLLLPEFTVDDLREMWDSRPLFADDIIWQTGRMLGGSPIENDPNYHPELCTQLHFRYIGPRSHEQKAEGPPQFELGSYGSPHEASLGEIITLTVSINNRGGASEGMSVVVWGDLLDQGAIQPGKASIRHGAEGARHDYTFEQTPAQIANRVIQTAVVALPDFTFDAGTLSVDFTPEEYRLFGRDAHVDSLNRAIWVDVELRAVKEGSGELGIGFVPHANPKAGQTGYPMNITIYPAPRKPLNYMAREGTPEHVNFRYLRDIENDRQFFVMAVFSKPAEMIAGEAAGLIKQWHAALGKEHHLAASIWSDWRTLSDEKTVSTEELREIIPACVSLSNSWKIDPAFVDPDLKFGPPIPLDHAGFSYTGASIAAQGKTAPHLVLWVDTRIVDGERLNQLKDAVMNWVDALARKGWLHQAMSTAWRAAPTHVDSTSYELACGVHDQATVTDEWCGRFLRGVSSRLWLGASLLNEVPDHDALEDAAVVSELGDAIRLDLRPDVTLDQLERALSSILPTNADWVAAMKRLYPRPQP